MTTEAELSPQDADDALAAEFALGVLELGERLAVERRLADDAALAARVARWQSHFAGLDGAFAPVTPPGDLITRVEARLWGQQPRRSSWRGWAGWLAGVTTALALFLGAAVLVFPPEPSRLIATLGAEDAPLRFQARFDGERLTVTRVKGSPAPAGQVHEVWIIAPDAKPVALGLLAEAALSVPYPDAPNGWTIAVSLEPAGGSPGDGPTGPVLAAGVIDGV